MRPHNGNVYLTISLLLLLLSLFATAHAGTITVDDDGPADFNNIQAAINYANHGDVVIVEPGTYTGPGNYNIRFNGKAITVRGTNPDDFDIVAATVIDCNHQGQGFIFDRGEDANSVLSGLKITHGRMRFGFVRGGGITCENSSPVICNCIITRNWAYYGAGISSRDEDLIVRNCIITHNSAEVYGGGIYAGHLRSATIENCIITANTAGSRGGAIYGSSWAHVIDKCTITGNRSDDIGGGICSRLGPAIITACTIAGNVALNSGGGFCGIRSSRPIISNSILSSNSAPRGPEIAVFDGYDSTSPDIGIAALFALYSNIRGGQAGIYNDGTFTLNYTVGNIDADPCFADAGYWGDIADANIHVEPNDPNAAWVDGDYHLKSQAGRWDPTAQSWILDDVSSLCIDAADPMLPLGAEPFPNGGRINMGVYGATIQASKSYFGKPPCPTIVAGDINGDCKVDARDFAVIAGHWLIAAPLGLDHPTLPNPPDGATGVRLNTVVSWTPGANAVSHDVYFGTQSPGTFQRSQTETTFQTSAISPETTYYWRIDEINPNGTTTGPVWTFTTGAGGGR